MQYIRITDIDVNGKLRSNTFRSLPIEIAQDYLLNHGDVLFARSGATVGKTFLYFNEYGICAFAGYLIRARLKPNLIMPKFLRYYTDSKQYWKWIDYCQIQTTIQNVSAEKYNELPIPIPPHCEQEQIVCYLDWQVSRINGLLSAKKKLIALLKEQKQAIINQAVTGGLDPNAPTKESGIPWLGKIPEHWEVSRLKTLLNEKLRYGANESSGYSDITQPRYIRITDIDVNGKLRSNTFRSLPIEIAQDYLLNHGDVLFARSGATVGKTFLYFNEYGICAFAGYLIRARLKPNLIMPKFLRYYTDSKQYWKWIDYCQIQTTIQNVSAEKYNELPIPIPPHCEQEQIVQYLDDKTLRIDNLITKIEREIELLQEYRTRLISDVVTGQIDVRGIEIPDYLPVDEIADDLDEINPDENFDEEDE